MFVKPLLSELCSFLGHFSFAPECCVIQNLSQAKMPKPEWKRRTGFLPSGLQTVLVTISETEIPFSFFTRSLAGPISSYITTKTIGTHESDEFLTILHIFYDFFFSHCICLNTTWNFLGMVSYLLKSNAL